MQFSSRKTTSFQEFIDLLHLWIAIMLNPNFSYVFGKTSKPLLHVLGDGVKWVSYFHALSSDIVSEGDFMMQDTYLQPLP